MASQPEEPYLVGNYRIQKTLGEGTFGKVKLAIHLPTQQLVAVKILQKQKIVEQADIERVTRQICILKILRHPNIIQLYQIVETSNAIHLVMEYAPRGELFDEIVKNKRLKEQQAVVYMQQILAGVEYIHRNGVVHRDLKPQNLLLDEDNNIKIVDFGLSNQYKPGDRLKTACGSPCYAAPEMIAGKKYECLGVDLWSCGIILYAMLCGFLPFEDPNTAKLYKKIMAGQYDTPKILSERSKNILKCLLNVNPATRYTLQQLRSSQWLKQIGSMYTAKGLIVGRDTLIADELVVSEMAKLNMDPAQVRTYIAHNRHNHITAHYFLLKKKLEKTSRNSQPSTQPFIPDLNLTQTLKANTHELREERDILKETVRTQQTGQYFHRVQECPTAKIATQKQKRKQAPKTERSGVDSPLIYRPTTKKQETNKISLKQTVKTPKNDESFNASTIINSLVQANKTKIIQQKLIPKKISPNREDNFIYKEEFKLFPKRKISITQQDVTTPNNRTSRNSEDKRDLSFSGVQFGTPRCAPSNDTYLRQQSSNKRREQLQKQIRQITLKIDKQINTLKQQNNNLTTSLHPQSPKYNHLIGSPNVHQRMHTEEPLSERSRGLRNTIGPSDRLNIKHIFQKGLQGEVVARVVHNDNHKIRYPQPVPRPTNSAFNQNIGHSESKEPYTLKGSLISSSMNSGGRLNTTSNASNQSFHEHSILSESMRVKGPPRIYNGPFSANCLFAIDAEELSTYVKNYLVNQHIVFKELQAYSFWLSQHNWVSVETLNGLCGFSIVVFTSSSTLSLHEQLISYLNQCF